MKVTKTVADGKGGTRQVEVDLNLHELDQMTGDDYKRYFHNADFRKEVDVLEQERKQKYLQRVAQSGGVPIDTNAGPE